MGPEPIWRLSLQEEIRTCRDMRADQQRDRPSEDMDKSPSASRGEGPRAKPTLLARSWPQASRAVRREVPVASASASVPDVPLQGLRPRSRSEPQVSPDSQGGQTASPRPAVRRTPKSHCRGLGSRLGLGLRSGHREQNDHGFVLCLVFVAGLFIS